MKYSILAYQSIEELSNLGIWLGIIISAGLVVRIINDFIHAFEDPEMGLKEAIVKSKKRIFAVIIALSATAIVGLFRSYYT